MPTAKLESRKTNCVYEIFKCRSIDEIKSAAQNFLDEAESISAVENGMLLWGLCREFASAFADWEKPYKSPEKGAAWNAVVVPPEHAPIMLLKSHVPIGGAPAKVIVGLRKFIHLCGEFTPPKFDAITLAEIKRLLNAAQKIYRLIDIIAPREPFKILRFGSSHAEHNSECAIPEDSRRAATLLLFHPIQNGDCDRVFIFAHELGHALHFALTGDINIFPAGFDEFNDQFKPKLETIVDKQEAFADAVAFALLNMRGFGNHFPNQFTKNMSPIFARYVRELCENALRQSCAYSESLPPVNLMWGRKLLTKAPR